MKTRIFKSGNSLAVRLPRELAFGSEAEEVEIVRHGNTLTIRPVEADTLADIGEVLKRFHTDFMSDGRDSHEEQERNWNPK